MYIYTHSSHKCLHDGTIYRHLQTMCALHIHALDTHKYRIHAQEHQVPHKGCARHMGAHPSLSCTHTSTDHCVPLRTPKPTERVHTQFCPPLPGPTLACPLPVPGHWAAPQVGRTFPEVSTHCFLCLFSSLLLLFGLEELKEK